MIIKSIKFLVVVVILAVVCLGAYPAYHAYKAARQARLVRQAKTYLAKAEERKALLCLQAALRYNSKDAEACRLMARVAENARSPAALVWRNRVVQVKPHSLDDRLALAQSAVIFHDYASATNALEGVDEAGKKTAAYHNVAGAVASTVNQLEEAATHFQEAGRLEPTNPVPRLNLAVVHLRSTNAAVLTEARASLTRIAATNSALRRDAMRELIVDALRTQQTNAALNLSQDLLRQTNSSVGDRLLRLNVLQASGTAEFSSTLAASQREAETNSANLYELGLWQMARTGPAATLAWLVTPMPASSTA